jgi:hypothetical protein
MKILLFLFLLGAVQFFSLIRTRSGRCSCCALILILLSPRAVDFLRFLTSVSLWFPLAFFFWQISSCVRLPLSELGIGFCRCGRRPSRSDSARGCFLGRSFQHCQSGLCCHRFGFLCRSRSGATCSDFGCYSAAHGRARPALILAATAPPDFLRASCQDSFFSSLVASGSRAVHVGWGFSIPHHERA